MYRTPFSRINFRKLTVKTMKQTFNISAQILAFFFIAFLCEFQYSKKNFYLKKFPKFISTCLPNTTNTGSLNA
jgi:hypothetical protein